MMNTNNKMQSMPQSIQTGASPLQRQAQKRAGNPGQFEFDGTLAQANAMAVAAGTQPQVQPASVPVPAAGGGQAGQTGAGKNTESLTSPQISAEAVVAADAATKALQTAEGERPGAEVMSAAGKAGAAALAATTADVSNPMGSQVANAANSTGIQSNSKGSQTNRSSGGQKSAGAGKLDTPATSLNAGAASTGLKPWSGEWVFGSGAALAEAKQMKNTPAPSNSNSSQVEMAAQRSNPAGSQVLNTAHTLGGDEAATAGAAMMPLLRELNGEVEEAVDQPRRPMQPVSAAGGLSGAEFVNALNEVRNGGGGQFGQNSNDGAGGRRDFRLIQGGGHAGSQPAAGIDPMAAEQSAGSSVLLKSSKPKIFGNGDEFSSLMDSRASLAGGTHVLSRAGFETQNAIPASVVTGHVVKGAMAQDRLSTESLVGVSSGIRNMGAQGGGEMRIRLKPEHLGELHVQVMTNGREVALRIQASDGTSRKVIEDSIGSLKESLAAQSLTLGSIEVSVAQPSSNRGDTGQDSGQQARHDQAFGGLMGDAQQGQGGRGNRNGIENDFAFSRPAADSVRATSRSFDSGSTGRSISASGRVDLMA